MLFGQTGLLSFGHAVYFGLGGVCGDPSDARDQPRPAGADRARAARRRGGRPAVAGIVFGSVTTKKAGTIFALITLGVGELVYAATFMLPGIFGGEEGVTASRTRAPALLRTRRSSSQLEVYYAIGAVGARRGRC